MIYLKKPALLGVLLIFFSAARCEELVRATVFDTEAKDKVVFAPQALIAKKAGLDLGYVGIDKIATEKVEELVEDSEEIVFFLINTELVRSLAEGPKNNEGLSKKYLDLISAVAAEPGKQVLSHAPGSWFKHRKKTQFFGPNYRAGF